MVKIGPYFHKSFKIIYLETSKFVFFHSQMFFDFFDIGYIVNVNLINFILSRFQNAPIIKEDINVFICGF
jgi:hypothetical protein